MDFFAHGLWSYIIFNWIRRPIYAIFFGLLPDLMSWTIYLFYRLFNGEAIGKPALLNIPDWVYMLYNVSHSLFVVLLVFGIVYLIFKTVPIYMYAWPLHIILDIFSHSREFLPTPFLWPISDWRFPGISWGHPTFMIINYALIGICLGYLVYKKRFEKK